MEQVVHSTVIGMDVQSKLVCCAMRQEGLELKTEKQTFGTLKTTRKPWLRGVPLFIPIL